VKYIESFSAMKTIDRKNIKDLKFDGIISIYIFDDEIKWENNIKKLKQFAK